MTFDVPAEAYQRFMGRYSEPLAQRTLDVVGELDGVRALDVGAGPGAIAAALTATPGVTPVAAVDPSPSFVEALRERLPGCDARVADAESLPFADDAFDLVIAQLVVNFLRDPHAAIREMARVTRPGGVIAASVWDFDGGRAPLSLFWHAARERDPTVDDETGGVGTGRGQIADLFRSNGLVEVVEHELEVHVPYTGVDDWWGPYELGVGPAGAFVATLDAAARAELGVRCGALLPGPSGVIDAVAWCAVGRTPRIDR
jgi:SAM-dependent methyltransferase